MSCDAFIPPLVYAHQKCLRMFTRTSVEECWPQYCAYWKLHKQSQRVEWANELSYPFTDILCRNKNQHIITPIISVGESHKESQVWQSHKNPTILWGYYSHLQMKKEARKIDSPRVTMLAYGGISEARKSKMVEIFSDSRENPTENSLSIFSHKPKLFGNECSIRCKTIWPCYHPVSV